MKLKIIALSTFAGLKYAGAIDEDKMTKKSKSKAAKIISEDEDFR